MALLLWVVLGQGHGSEGVLGPILEMDYTPHHCCEQHILRGVHVTQHLNSMFEVTTCDLTDRFAFKLNQNSLAWTLPLGYVLVVSTESKMKVTMLEYVRHTLSSSTLIFLLGDSVLFTGQHACLGLSAPKDGSSGKLGWRNKH